MAELITIAYDCTRPPLLAVMGYACMLVSVMMSVQVACSIPIGRDRASCLMALWNGRGGDVAWTLHPQEGVASRLCPCYLCSAMGRQCSFVVQHPAEVLSA